MSRFKRNVKVPMPDFDDNERTLFGLFFKFFGGMGCAFIIAWLVSALASLALVGAIIYFLIKAAGTF